MIKELRKYLLADMRKVYEKTYFDSAPLIAKYPHCVAELRQFSVDDVYRYFNLTINAWDKDTSESINEIQDNFAKLFGCYRNSTDEMLIFVDNQGSRNNINDAESTLRCEQQTFTVRILERG